MEHTDPVAAAQRVAYELLIPRAEDTDQAAVVPRGNLEALAQAGLYGLACPGPSQASGPAMRQVQEILAGACGATYFVWAQHHSPVRLLAATANDGLRRRWLEPLCSGQALAGVAFAYLRRPGPAAVTAEPVGGGWLVNGTAPFVTSWGLADLFVVVAATGDGQLVWFCLQGRATPAVSPSAPLALAVLQATSTVQLTFDGLLVGNDDVLGVEPLAAWRGRDRLATAQPSAAAFGLAGRGCALLAERAQEAPQVGEAAAALAHELGRCRDHGYGLADALAGGVMPLPVDAAGPGETDPGEAGDRLDEHLAAMVAARAWALDLAQRGALALVAAVGGRAMTRSHPAQRLVREAAFYAVQAQTGALRTATLGRLSAPGTICDGGPTPLS
ncbi:MAG: hypothetical protein DLM54_07370 [Acidimicrobiales bacterium]|nr:MAG: hypothetical protein DLM54_07370 [Acidimicrobiales bacterium]